jgi:hypothetical protein
MTVDTYPKWLPSGNKDAIERFDETPIPAVQEVKITFRSKDGSKPHQIGPAYLRK